MELGVIAILGPMPMVTCVRRKITVDPQQLMSYVGMSLFESQMVGSRDGKNVFPFNYWGKRDR